MSSDFAIVFVTTSSVDVAVKLGTALVEERLAACVQVVPGGTAIYRWQDAIINESQTQLIIKTRKTTLRALEERVLALHSDEVPELLAVQVLRGSDPYLAWLDANMIGGKEEWLGYRQLHPSGEHTVRGNVQVLPAFYSPELGNTRDILVYLPPSYGETTRRYPVIYMHDGQNLFDAATSFAGEWQVDETLESLTEEGIEAIIVGVPHMNERRFMEYIPFPAPDLAQAQGDDYIRFLTETLKPRIDRDFRTRPERSNTALMGSSLGGLISVFGFFRRSDVFGLAGAFSPAFEAGARCIRNYIAATTFVAGKIYLDVGTNERVGFVKEADRERFARHYLRDVQQVKDLLRRKGYQPGQDLLYIEEEGGTHDESSWSRRLPAALRFLFKSDR